MSATLFREEAVQAQAASFLGAIRVAHRPGHWAAAGGALVVALALVGFSAWGEVTRKAHVPGLLMPQQGTLPLSANAAGTLTERRVREGEFVHAGQVLFIITTERRAEQGDTALLVAQTLQQREQSLHTERTLREVQSRQRQQALSDRLRSMSMEAEQAQSEAALAQRRVDLAQRSLERVRHLAQDGFVADAQVQSKQEELLDLQARAQAAQRNALSLQRELRAVHAERAATATQLQTDLAQADRALASLTQDRTENDARRTQIIVAPQSGVVTALHLSVGAPVQPGQSVATLVPQNRADDTAVLEAELYAASRTAGFVRAGQEVYLRYAAYPYQKFGLARGTVTRVSRTPVAPQDLPAGQQQALMSATQSNEPLYRIKVALDHQVIQAYGQAQALKPGMTLEADIVQDRRALWEWMFEPLLALKHRA